ncbi:pilus assembly protein N-terminal domain-containing protein [Hyalangium rubrum]|uniref:Pilus assembly protein N-terminal domain-containing protein n=1 Tax=Hyalangium rubrum TaxID=3103134 RepID=A0ABU5GZ86_9BACT|nr:pilus assembly protein N-terminal domain-containing protein [Hyalangium sp. s54d21]MDY7226489.1 pilus assembly protein N-terminal domain-containing protein [Hyalangium sp. s54d21]
MRHFVRGTLVVLSLLSVPAFAEPPAKGGPVKVDDTITVRAGNAKALKVPGVTRVALGDPDVGDVEVTGDDVLRIEGRKAGETTLIVWTDETRTVYRVVVQK